jgi:sugar phosphate permease
MSFSGRIGQLLFFIGLIILVIFFATNKIEDPVYSFFCVGTLLLIFGLVLLFRGRRPPSDTGRFRSLRKMNEKDKKKKAG